MRHCEVEMQVVDSAVLQRQEGAADRLTFRCPVCGARREEEYPRKAGETPAGQSRGLPNGQSA